MHSMEVQVQSSTIIGNGDPKKTPLEIPLSVFDRSAPYYHVPVLYAFNRPTASNPVIIAALVKTLSHFPTLTGRLSTTSRLPCVLIGGPDSGALLVESQVSSNLSDHLPLEPSPDLKLLHPQCEGVPYLFTVQLNRFQCGSLIVGVTSSHRVADGKSLSTFLISWGNAIRGVPIDPLLVFNQPRFKPRQPPRCKYQHWGREFAPHQQDALTWKPINVDPERITTVLLHFSPEFIKDKLRPTDFERITKVLLHFSPEFIKGKLRPTQRHTTFEALSGHIWRKITIARGLDGDKHTIATFSVNGRRRLQPPVSSEFFGNLVLHAYAMTKAKDLVDQGLEGAARRVREAVSEIGEEYLRSFIDFGALHEEEELVSVYDGYGNVLSPNVEVHSWLGFKIEEMDFAGGGKPCGILPTGELLDGVVVFLPSMRPEGGIDVVVDLMEEHALKLRDIAYDT